MKVSASQVKTRLFIGNVPRHWSDDDLKSEVEKVGPGVILVELKKVWILLNDLCLSLSPSPSPSLYLSTSLSPIPIFIIFTCMSIPISSPIAISVAIKCLCQSFVLLIF